MTYIYNSRCVTRNHHKAFSVCSDDVLTHSAPCCAVWLAPLLCRSFAFVLHRREVTRSPYLHEEDSRISISLQRVSQDYSKSHSPCCTVATICKQCQNMLLKERRLQRTSSYHPHHVIEDVKDVSAIAYLRVLTLSFWVYFLLFGTPETTQKRN